MNDNQKIFLAIISLACEFTIWYLSSYLNWNGLLPLIIMGVFAWFGFFLAISAIKQLYIERGKNET